jgi:hypothetical protein
MTVMRTWSNWSTIRSCLCHSNNNSKKGIMRSSTTSNVVAIVQVKKVPSRTDGDPKRHRVLPHTLLPARSVGYYDDSNDALQRAVLSHTRLQQDCWCQRLIAIALHLQVQSKTCSTLPLWIGRSLPGLEILVFSVQCIKYKTDTSSVPYRPRINEAERS